MIPMSEGDSRVEQYMHPISEAISRHLRGADASTDIYNRAYEAVHQAIKDHGDRPTSLKRGEEIQLTDHDWFNINAGDEFDDVEIAKSYAKLQKAYFYLLSSEQALKDENDHYVLMMKNGAEVFEEEMVEWKNKLNQAVKVLKEVRDCLDDFYTREHPRRLHPELRYLAGQISVMDKTTTKFLSSLSQGTEETK